MAKSGTPKIVKDMTSGALGPFLEAEVCHHKEVYHLVSEDNLKAIMGKGLLSDLFLVITSILWGAYLSSFLTIKTLDPKTTSTYAELHAYANAFLVAALAASAIAALLLIINYWSIHKIRRQPKVEG
ncbi:MAG: hypothetical protein KJ757_01770 [Planctomycetes bacterium]|nr:hypothetical protein [Planctomycetota bacterium]MBU1519002.1 hypothetical protein [Planctomycetota bacterium]MBU2457438.1 hypothetical protein [Planctomycetota bacterium]MBU2596278.1 hypothetical protein [Planctomycetota bacterium]